MGSRSIVIYVNFPLRENFPSTKSVYAVLGQGIELSTGLKGFSGRYDEPIPLAQHALDGVPQHRDIFELPPASVCMFARDPRSTTVWRVFVQLSLFELPQICSHITFYIYFQNVYFFKNIWVVFPPFHFLFYSSFFFDSRFFQRHPLDYECNLPVKNWQGVPL